MEVNQNSKIRSGKTLSWSTREPNRGRRWWAFVLVAYFAPLVDILLLVNGNWAAALVVFTSAVTFFVVYLPRPKVWSYTITGTELKATREHLRGPADELTINLRDYHSIDVHVATRKHSSSVEPAVLTLWPDRRFGRDVDIYLPANNRELRRAVILAVRLGASGRRFR